MTSLLLLLSSLNTATVGKREKGKPATDNTRACVQRVNKKRKGLLHLHERCPNLFERAKNKLHPSPCTTNSLITQAPVDDRLLFPKLQGRPTCSITCIQWGHLWVRVCDNKTKWSSLLCPCLS
ncbi:hypothetical protein B0O80DRAFT_471420 [Mortierella sp. GBAus27b]|nr:hypothetical protein B0O80DRAFT_471420 [Mortierella sp. GBAus27b]